MFRAHELISVLKTESQDYADCISAVKFDLGEMKNINMMADISTKEFFDIPAPICLFQVTQEMDLHFFLAKKDFGGVVWRRFGKQLNDGFEWHQEDIEFFIETNGDAICIGRISTGEKFSSVDLPFEELTASQQWTIAIFIEVATSIEVFSCSNIVTTEHNPPKLINEKRKKKGKQPFFSYRTLHIKGETQLKESTANGSNSSPRLHFRRGHIRRLAGGGKVWVTSCLVGDKSKGFALHDYKVRMPPTLPQP